MRPEDPLTAPKQLGDPGSYAQHPAKIPAERLRNGGIFGHGLEERLTIPAVYIGFAI
jgi:hypothetical protein